MAANFYCHLVWSEVGGMAKFDSKFAVYGTAPDLEAGYGTTPALYPGISADENELRWGLIRKVYSILSIQVLLTAAVASFVVFTPAVLEFFASHAWILLFTSFAPLICEFWTLSVSLFWFGGLCSCCRVIVSFNWW